MKIFLRGLNSCMMRKADIERYRRALTKAGHEMVDTAEEANSILVWTCAFRQDFRDASAKVVQQYKDHYVGKRVIALGCLPDIDREFLAHRFKGTSISWRNEEVGLAALFNTGPLNDRPLVEAPLPVSREEYERTYPNVKTTHCDQFIKLFTSEGCPFNCTYCAEVRAFPKFRSFPLDDIVAECRRMVTLTGEHRVVLHGDCVGEYGKDRMDGPTFGQLLLELQKEVPGILIGLRNVHPRSLLDSWQDTVLDFMRNGRIFLLEVPIQSANDRILQLMGRGCTKFQLTRLFQHISRIGFSELETHIIAGFPGETDEEFQETVDFLVQQRPKYVLVSGYMAAPGSVAADLPDHVPVETIRARVLMAYEQLKKANIIVNYDSCELCKKRFEQPLVGGLFI